MVFGRQPQASRISTRAQSPQIETENVEQFSAEFMAAEFLRMREALGELARQTENRGNPVDEYNTCPISGTAQEQQLTVMPQYEYMPEKIVSILVCGPAAAAITLQLGDRQLPFIIPPSGILPIGPVAMILGRNDLRQLTAATPGIYFMELMGWADRRFKI